MLRASPLEKLIYAATQGSSLEQVAGQGICAKIIIAICRIEGVGLMMDQLSGRAECDKEFLGAGGVHLRKKTAWARIEEFCNAGQLELKHSDGTSEVVPITYMGRGVTKDVCKTSQRVKKCSTLTEFVIVKITRSTSHHDNSDLAASCSQSCLAGYVPSSWP
jgi:hypothetical protein